MSNLMIYQRKNKINQSLILITTSVILVVFGLVFSQNLQEARANPEFFTEEIEVCGVIPPNQTLIYEKFLSIMPLGDSIIFNNYRGAGHSICLNALKTPNNINTPITSNLVRQELLYEEEVTGFIQTTISPGQFSAKTILYRTRGLIDWLPSEVRKSEVVCNDSKFKASAKQIFQNTESDFPACPSGITSFFHLDETSSPYHDTFSGLQGTCINCPVPGIGLVGNAQQFGGEDEVNIAPDASFDWGAEDSFSIEFWVWKDSECTGNEVIVGRDDGMSNLHMWVGCLSSGNAFFRLHDTSGAGYYVASAAVLNNGQWHHIAAVRDASSNTNTIYLDAVPASFLYTYSNGFDSATAPVSIGYMNLDTHYRFDGLLDEVVIYNRALTADEVQNHVDHYESLSYCKIASSSYPLSITKDGVGTVVSDPAGIDCGTTCSADFAYNTLVTLTATPAAGWVFSGWSGDCSGTTCQVTMDQARNVTATFGPAMPIITSSPVTTAEVGIAYTYDVDATGHPAPSYTLSTSPVGMTIDPNSGLIEWLPNSAGEFDATVEAANSEGSDTQSFTITVSDLPFCPIGITSFFHLDEANSPYFDAISGLQGTCANCPVSGIGLVGNAQQFDGIDDEVNVAPDASFDWGVEDSFSIEFWVWKGTLCTGNEVIVGRDDGMSNLHMLVGCNIEGKANFYLLDKSGGGAYLVSTSIMNNGQWHHIAAVRDATTDTNYIYLDGVSSSIKYDYLFGFDSATAPVNIGYLSLDSHYRFDGLLDELVVYNRALTADEVQDHVDNFESLSNCTIASSSYLLSITKVGEGTIISDPAGIDCGTTCSGDFEENTTVNLTATPTAGWVFSGWSGDCTGTTCQVSMDQARNLTATFSVIPPTCYVLTLGHTGNGTDPVATPANSTNCPDGQYISGESITLSGTAPDIGWEITGWTGTSDDISTVNTNSMVMPEREHSANVIYSEISPPCYALTLSSGDNGGDPTADPINSIGCDPSEYIEGEVITFTAHPDPDYRVESWTGTVDDTNTTLTNQVAMPGSLHSVSVIYSQITFEHQIALIPGWNLVSFNLRPINTDINNVLISLDDSYSLVYAWDAHSAIWLKYDPKQGFGNTLTNLDETMGFWILMSQNATLSLTGTKPSNTNINLLPGWNLIGYPSTSNRDLPSGFTDNGIPGDDLNKIMSYQAQDTGDPWKMYDQDLAGTFPFANDLVTLSPGLGFWVLLDNAGTWNLDFILH